MSQCCMSPNAHCYNKEQSNIISVDKERHLYKCQQWMNTSTITHFVINYYVIDWWWRHWWMMTSSVMLQSIFTFPFRFPRSKNTKWNISDQRWIWFSMQKSLNLPFSIWWKIYIFDIFRRKSIFENFLKV